MDLYSAAVFLASALSSVETDEGVFLDLFSVTFSLQQLLRCSSNTTDGTDIIQWGHNSNEIPFGNHSVWWTNHLGQNYSKVRVTIQTE